MWTTAYELLHQWIGQAVTPYRRNDAPVNKALNSFLASMTTIDVSLDYLFLFYFIFKSNDVNIIKNIERLFILEKYYYIVEIGYIECQRIIALNLSFIFYNKIVKLLV